MVPCSGGVRITLPLTAKMLQLLTSSRYLRAHAWVARGSNVTAALCPSTPAHRAGALPRVSNVHARVGLRVQVHDVAVAALLGLQLGHQHLRAHTSTARQVCGLRHSPAALHQQRLPASCSPASSCPPPWCRPCPQARRGGSAPPRSGRWGSAGRSAQGVSASREPANVPSPSAHMTTVRVTPSSGTHLEVGAHGGGVNGKGVLWRGAQAQDRPAPKQQRANVQRALAQGWHLRSRTHT